MCERTHKHRLQQHWSSPLPGHANPGCLGILVHALSMTLSFIRSDYFQHLCNVTCRPLTLWPSDHYGPRWVGQEAWVACGDGRMREVPANAAKGSTPLMTLPPRHYHARIVMHYHAS
jgi:hypothetical protein